MTRQRASAGTVRMPDVSGARRNVVTTQTKAMMAPKTPTARGKKPGPGRAAVPCGSGSALPRYTPLAASTVSATSRSIIELLLRDHAQTREDLGVILVLLPQIGAELVTRAVVDVDHALLDRGDELRFLHRALDGVVNVLLHGAGRALGRHEHERGAADGVPPHVPGARRVGVGGVALRLEHHQHPHLAALDQRLDLAGLGHQALDVTAEQRRARLAPARDGS